MHRIAIDNLPVEASGQVHCELSAVISKERVGGEGRAAETHLGLAGSSRADDSYKGLLLLHGPYPPREKRSNEANKPGHQKAKRIELSMVNPLIRGGVNFSAVRDKSILGRGESAAMKSFVIYHYLSMRTSSPHVLHPRCLPSIFRSSSALVPFKYKAEDSGQQHPLRKCLAPIPVRHRRQSMSSTSRTASRTDLPAW